MSASTTTDGDLIAAGYQLLRTEGYIFTSALANTTPMRLWWHAGFTDHATTIYTMPALGGYSFVRDEGHALSINN